MSNEQGGHWDASGLQIRPSETLVFNMTSSLKINPFLLLPLSNSSSLLLSF